MRRISLVLAGVLLLAGCAGSQEMASKPENPLVGSDWMLVALDGSPVAADSTASLTFASQTSVNGNGGCNNFVGGVTLAGSSLAFGNLASTRMACMGEAMTLETRYFEALSQVTSYQQEGDRLLLMGPSGSVLVQLHRVG